MPRNKKHIQFSRSASVDSESSGASSRGASGRGVEMRTVTHIAASMVLGGLLLAGCPGALNYDPRSGSGGDGGGAGQDGGTDCRTICVGDVDDAVV